MINSNKPLSLSKIQICAYSPDDEIANGYPLYEIFDNRHDFPMEFTQSGIAVMLTFFNNRSAATRGARGIRRAVSVSIIDDTESSVVASTTLRVNIPGNTDVKLYRADLPFAYANIDARHSYRVIIKDENSGAMLGVTVFRMFDLCSLGKDPDKWYIPTTGGIIPEWSCDMYRAINVHGIESMKVKFELQPAFKSCPVIFPELEIRLYTPDGKTKINFISPDCDDFDMNEYSVEMPVLVGPDSSGIYYAELLCMEYPIAGMVFCTDCRAEEGYYFGDSLACMEEYSPASALDRFRSMMKTEETEGDKKDVDETEEDDDKDPFERALEEFISNELKDVSNELKALGLDELQDDSTEETIAEEETDETNDNETSAESAPPAEPEDIIRSSPRLCLDRLVGLKAVKEKLDVYEKIVLFNKLREENGLGTSPLPLHAMFLGSPGTGKTTVAKMMGFMLRKAGVLSKGHVVVKVRSSLIGRYYGDEETNTRKALEEAQGGILLIDEAYQLYQPDDPRDPGKLVIESLMTALADESNRDWMLILAGYPEEMKLMFGMNPGLRSRIPDSNIYMFDDFSESELMEIAERYLQGKQYTLSCEAREALSRRLGDDYSRRDKSFGNARHVVNMIQTEILPAMAVRVISGNINDPQALSEIQACDIPKPTIIAGQPRRRIGYCA